jgi:uncharacterized protein
MKAYLPSTYDAFVDRGIILAMTLSTLPLFPLTTILFPDGALPLQIFELRYLTMIKQCIADGTEFGVVAQTQRRNAPPNEVTRAPLAEPMSQETFTSIGTTAKIVSHAAPHPGLLRIECLGGQRFTVVSAEQGKLGLWVAKINRMEADQVITVPAELENTAMALRQLVSALSLQIAEGQYAPVAKPYRFDDCGWVANRWCELIPIQPAQRQSLLALENPVIRLELVQDLLYAGGFLR